MLFSLHNSSSSSSVTKTSINTTSTTTSSFSKPFHYAASVKCVLIISSGRAGTTKMMDELKVLEAAFHIQEPFLQSFRHHLETPPKYEDIFSCDAYRTHPQHILWAYACTQTPAFTSTEYFQHICETNPLLFGKIAYKFCKQSSIRILKTIRFDRYHDLLFPPECSEKKIINNIRHPWNLGNSIFAIGWGVDTSKLTSTSGILSELLKVTIVRCEMVKAQLTHLQSFMKSSHAENVKVLNIVHNEDFADHKNSLDVLDFIFEKELMDVVWKNTYYSTLRKAFVDHLKSTVSYFPTFSKPYQHFLKRFDRDFLIDRVWTEAQNMPACQYLLDYIDSVSVDKIKN
eukprot:m.9554 g.9554  ORF g.9554 m.9554 type:complete len:343 (+) comp3491_c0_seq1:456-1484(+)